jgi:hypothetical protein
VEIDKEQPIHRKIHHHLKQTQETMALLKILALGNHQFEEGKVQPAGEVKLLRGRGKSR